MPDTNARQRWRDNEGSGGMVGDRPSEGQINDASTVFVGMVSLMTAKFLHDVGATEKQARDAAQLMAETLHDLVQDATAPQLRELED